MEEKTLTHEESIQIINSMILTARNHYYENGLSAILWGVTNVVCFVLAYLMSAVKGFSFPFNPFFLMVSHLSCSCISTERKGNTAQPKPMPVK